MRKMAPINVIVYYPKTEEGRDYRVEELPW